VDVKLKIELSNGGRVVSLDEFTKTFLEAIQGAVRQEFQRLQIPSAPPEEPASTSVPESRRALAVSKTEAARILGVSRRTIDYSIALKQIAVLRVGRRVLVPIRSLEAVMRRGSLQTGRHDTTRQTP
jgi:excisionase family DNA binding protein